MHLNRKRISFNTEPTVSAEADGAELLVQPEDRVSFNKYAKTQTF